MHSGRAARHFLRKFLDRLHMVPLVRWLARHPAAWHSNNLMKAVRPGCHSWHPTLPTQYATVPFTKCSSTIMTLLLIYRTSSRTEHPTLCKLYNLLESQRHTASTLGQLHLLLAEKQLHQLAGKHQSDQALSCLADHLDTTGTIPPLASITALVHHSATAGH
jgi:hypothetical protein